MAPQYILRRETLEDLESSQKALKAAFITSPLTASVWHKATEEEKQTLMDGWFLGRARADFHTPGTHRIVVVCRDDESGSEEVAGAGYWRQPLTEVDPGAGKTEEQKAAETAAQRATWPACVDVSVLDANGAELKGLVDRELGDEAKAMWVANVVAVHPKHQRKGVATTLMRWGLAEADKTGADTFIIASDVGRKAYLTVGFEDRCELKGIIGECTLMVRKSPVRKGV
ncbi:hypothetical protein RB595_008571 [Gaeumannomyces hyphopodioides]